MTHSDFWTQARTDEAVRMWRSGISAGQVAEQMGTTRNAIIGKMARMGYKFDHRFAPVSESVGNPWSHDEARDMGLERVKIIKVAAKRAPGNTSSMSAPVVVASLAGRPETVVSLLDLGAMQCKFPFGDVGQEGFGFCGERVAVAGAAYCPCHMKLAYRPACNKRRAA